MYSAAPVDWATERSSEEFYPSAMMQFVDSAAPANRGMDSHIRFERLNWIQMKLIEHRDSEEQNRLIWDLNEIVVSWWIGEDLQVKK